MNYPTPFSRKQCMAVPFEQQTAAHNHYYGQFASVAVRVLVTRAIGFDRIKASADPHFNDIPLHEWDALVPFMKDLCLSRMADANGALSVDVFGRRSVLWSISDGVCIAKAAARLIKAEA